MPGLTVLRQWDARGEVRRVAVSPGGQFVAAATGKRLLVWAASGRGEASAEPANFEEFIYKVWGAGIAKHFAIPYNRKIWAVDLKEMETSWLGGRVPLPDLDARPIP